MHREASSTGKRHRRGEDTVGLHVKVPGTTRSLANETAASMGITMGRYIEILIARDTLDQHGRSRWATADVDLTKTIPMPPQQGTIAA